MIPSLEYLERCSAETGYQISPLEKVIRLGAMAGDIARHPFLRTALALKGGTALNLCFGPPKRLSVDLDFNYIRHTDRQRMLQDRPAVEEALVQLALRHGYHVQQSAETFAGRKLYLNYRSALGQAERIEVDVNYLFRLSIAGTAWRSLWQPGALDRPHIRVVSLTELLIGKLLAFFDRGAARDLWDVAHFPASAAAILGSRCFRRRFVALSALLPHPLPTYSRDRLGHLVSAGFLYEHLTPMLVAGSLPEIGRLIEKAWAVAGRFVTLEANEIAYVTAIEQGAFFIGLLFENDPNEAHRLARHPAILWKVANVRAHLTRQDRT